MTALADSEERGSATSSTPASPRTPRRPRRRFTAEALSAYAFLLPSMVPFVVFVALPAVAGLALSFFSWDFITTPEFVGFDNWSNLFSSDSRALKSLFVTMGLAVLTVPTAMALGLALALALNELVYGRRLFRSIFFAPVVTSLVPISFVWQNLYGTETGLINYMLGWVGLGPVSWLSGSDLLALVSVAIMLVWTLVGINMLIYLAGLQQLDRSLLEAAEMDGAELRRRVWHIVLPQLNRATFLILITSTIGALQTFEAVFVLTEGGPGDATRTTVLFIVESAFRNFDVGLAAATSATLFLVILALTLLQLRIHRRFNDE